jgi:hypothetical protein
MQVFFGILLFLIVVVAAMYWVAAKALTAKAIMAFTATTPDGKAFSVKIDRYRGEVDQIEWVWLCILYAAKVLYVIGDESSSETSDFKGCMDRLGSTELSALRIQIVCGLICSDLPEISEYELNGRSVKAVLSYLNENARSVQTSLPLQPYRNQYLNTWICLLVSAVKNMDSHHKQILRCALRNMAVSYRSHSTCSMGSMATVSSEAVRNAIAECAADGAR